MTLNELITSALDELQEARQHENKKHYRVEELTIEVNLSDVQSVGGGLNLSLFQANTNQALGNSHRITVKLKPKHNRNQIDVSINS